MIPRASRALRPVLLALGAGLAAGTDARTAEPERVALVIGNGAYEADGWELATPAEDAALVADALEGAGFDAELVLDADLGAMGEAVDRFAARISAAGDEAAGFFYFTGHALRARGVIHLLPVDAAVGETGDLRDEAPRLERLLDAMEPLHGERSFVVLDACGRTPLHEAEPDSRACAPTPPGRSHRALLAFSAGAEDDGEEAAGRSIYAEALAAALRVRALNAVDAFEQASERVVTVTGGRQRPWIERGAEGELFYFSGAPSQADYGARVAEAVRWDFARRRHTPDAYRGYIAAHPNGRHLGPALARIAALDRTDDLEPPAPGEEEEADAPAAASRSRGEAAAAAEAGGKFRAPDLEDVLVLETSKGLVVIEMLPELAPVSVARIRELARQGDLDGVAFQRVVDGFRAEAVLRRAAADSAPDALPGELAAPARITLATVEVADSDRNRLGVYAGGDFAFGIYKGAPAAELQDQGERRAWVTHCPGVASMTRQDDADDATIFIMRGEAPGLDEVAQPWGRVIEGLEVVYDFAAADPLAPVFEPDRILAAYVAADAVDARPTGGLRTLSGHVDYPAITILDERSPAFEEFVASLRERLGRAPRVCEIRPPLGAAVARLTAASGEAP